MEAQQTIGIVGGGQLGRMLTLAALPLGFKVVVLDPSDVAPAAQVGASQIHADFYDKAGLKKLAKASDYITIEIEHTDADVLEAIERAGTPVNPSPKTIRLIQDKFLQKEFLSKKGLPTAPYEEIKDEKSACKVLKKFGGHMLLKTRHGAYDGRGNYLVHSEQDLQAAMKQFAGKKLYAEEVIPFVKELAVMVVRDAKGRIKTYPVVETVHARNICLEVTAPAEVSTLVLRRAAAVATKVAKQLQGAGMFGIEMFLTKDDKILINEIAPRVHNSGHYTMEACRTSQFEQHIRAITGLPLGNTDLLVPAAVMINILGEDNHPTKLTGLEASLSSAHTSVHVYGKGPTKLDRKMGHLTATGKTVKQARSRARQARKALSI
jgi:phosphoribosylaminoimidazole carboxylase PurK protein